MHNIGAAHSGRDYQANTCGWKIDRKKLCRKKQSKAVVDPAFQMCHIS
jgi:hypothetical protein